MSSDGPGRRDNLQRASARLLTELAATMRAELGGPPSLAELLEVLGWAVPTREQMLQTPAGTVRFVARPGRPGRDGPATTRVGDLNDWVFADATAVLADLVRQMAVESGGPVTLDDLAVVLARGLRAAAAVIGDAAPGDVTSIEVVKPKVSKRVRVGDLIAIPLDHGGYRIAVVLARDSFGTGLGLMRGVVAAPRLPTAGPPAFVPYALYTDEQLVADGVWLVIGHDVDLVATLPGRAEIYHRPGTNLPDPQMQQFGAAETAAGELRPISHEEARLVGLEDGSYRQGCTSEWLHSRLNAGEFR